VTGEQPAKQSRAGHDFRQHLIAERVHLDDRRMRGHDATIREGRMDAAAGQLACHERNITRRRAHDHADSGLVGAHVGERVDTQQHVGQSRHLVGGQRPGADRKQQQERGGKRDQPQPPQRDRAHTPRRVEYEIDRGGLLIARGLRTTGRRRGRGMADDCRQPDRRLSRRLRTGTATVAHQQLLQ